MKWRLNKIQYPVYNLGPGKRIGIWVQGCDLACKGCINEMLWTKKGGEEIDILEVCNFIAEIAENYDGVTITGGEPFQQYEQLVVFLHLIKTKTQLNTYCFSGYTLTELSEIFSKNLAFEYLDYLVDGRYQVEFHDDSNKKGSYNQNIYHFINKQPTIISDNNIDGGLKWSIFMDKDSQIYLSGIPRKNDINQICNDFSQINHIIKFK